MIDSKALLKALQLEVTKLEADLRKRCDADPAVDAPLLAQYDAARAKNRTALTYHAWREEELTQIAVAWVLGCVFVRFLEDNGLVETLYLAGPDAARIERARDHQLVFFRDHPGVTEREYLEHVFTETGRLPAMAEFFDRRHNPLWLVGPTGDAARALVEFWRKGDPEQGKIVIHDFSDPEWETRFLGDLYQELSVAAQEKFALLQTPLFVEEFILDRTLTPAIETFGFREVRMIDPTCGSGHFLLGGFARLFRLWQQAAPGENPRVLAQRALDAIHGVDLNPYAVAIARFRLLLAALRVCAAAEPGGRVSTLRHATDFKIHVAVGDSLLHGPEPGIVMDAALLRLRIESHVGTYQTEDAAALAAILSQHYHAVVGNPPYIQVNDKALSEGYRAMFKSCHREYSLIVPFMERFFDLAVVGDGTPQQPAGFVGKITANSFMKREFGKKLIEQFFPRWDITHVIDTSGAYIPGCGTPTVILFGRNQPPSTSLIRTVLGIRGEPPTPEDPAQGFVWQAVLRQVDQPGSESEWMSTANSPRAKFHKHPWSIGGGGVAELKDHIDLQAEERLGTKTSEIGCTAITGGDEVFVLGEGGTASRLAIEKSVRLVEGTEVRDWQVTEGQLAVWVYDDDFEVLGLDAIPRAHIVLWPSRQILKARKRFSIPVLECGLQWYEWREVYPSKLRKPLTICWGEVTTHNHFVLDRGGKVFKQTAPVLKLKANAGIDDHLELLSLLNSSTGCFWLKQVCHSKGGQGINEGAKAELWERFFQINGTKLATFPIPATRPLALAKALDTLAQELQRHAPAAVLAAAANHSRAALDAARAQWQATLARMIALQEELDWHCYRAYGLIEGDDLLAPTGPDGLPALDGPEPAVPALRFGERAFEILLARRMADGEEQSAWFERHSARPSAEPPATWPDGYRALFHRRCAAIQENKDLGLIERPEYKRRWNVEPWDEQFERAAREWLLGRLEGYFHEGSRVTALTESGPDAPSFSPAAAGFRAAAAPALTTTSQLAGAAQTDHAFLAVAELLHPPGFSVSKVVRELVESAAVPFLPIQRYKESGLRKRRDWEHVWELQREEDRRDAQRAALEKRIADRVAARLRAEHPALVAAAEQAQAALDTADRAFHERFHAARPYDPAHPHHEREGFPADPAEALAFMDVQKLRHARQDAEQALELERIEVTHTDEQCVGWRRQIEELPPKPTVPVPPKYASGDFKKSVWWSLRGKLDVPKERWISYPGTERHDDPSPVIAWAGWDHAQQARALAETYVDARDNWPATADKPAKLRHLLTGLLDLEPWLAQWHATLDPEFGDSPANAIRTFLDTECHAQGVTREDLERVRVGG